MSFFLFFDKWEETLLKFQDKLSIALMITYILRIGKQETKKTLVGNVSKEVKAKCPEIGDIDILKSFENFAKKLTKEAIDVVAASNEFYKEVAMIQALWENFTALMVCIATNNHLFICGKPGSSKTLTINLAKEILAKDFSNQEYLKKFTKARFDDFWGSMSTTSKGLKAKIDMVKAMALKEHSSNEAFVLIVDEIGLAEMSQDNPLKVLHSSLDPGSEDYSKELLEIFSAKYPEINIEQFKKEICGTTEAPSEEMVAKKIKEIDRRKFCFVGISNTKLDASKANRMTMVARPILGEAEYKETSIQLFQNICKEMIKDLET